MEDGPEMNFDELTMVDGVDIGTWLMVDIVWINLNMLDGR